MAEIQSLLQSVKPVFRNEVDALVAAVNATFIEFGFRVVGLESKFDTDGLFFSCSLGFPDL
jgi:hypothetical protein